MEVINNMFDRINKAHDYLGFFEKKIEEFGGVNKKNSSNKYVFRNNTNFKSNDNDGAYFGCINEGEDSTGAYSDLSIVIFPSNENDDVEDQWIIALGVGSLGFKNDYELASLAGTRRQFLKYLNRDSYVKNDFLDIESTDGIKSFCDKNNIPNTLKSAIKKYPKVLLVSTIFDPNKDTESKTVISTYLAIYAKLRKWPNKSQLVDINKVLKPTGTTTNEEDEIKKILSERKYVVLQGAPGTGKTRLAKNIPTKGDIVFFTQFHAETTYSDFIYGIIPEVNSASLRYIERKGPFVQAIEAALKSNKNVYLIIDEINRANLSNVLGSAFYLFEPTMSSNDIEIEICPKLKLKELPNNLYVIATMNTADRSLAVVDFALRRRFAWYTLYPHNIANQTAQGQHFCEDEFNAITEIFEKYATDEELTLQPGHAYFLVKDPGLNNPNRNKNMNDQMKSRLKYEIMPLIKEYLTDGMLPRAKDDFINYFRNEINEEMFR